ncbi:MAG: hypothetical protein HeimAB125_12040 [Candidatus Heimdallarchaeota archaeon AB_125]|nr:MAG: hypothetical protein HeimAB125_12040 [Candidatus Heimdallarchaeota archaeon AB_125]
MKGFPNELRDILHLLENNPLKSFSELAKVLSVSTQTFSRRFEELKKKEIIYEVHSSLNPESLLLERYVVIFIVNSIIDIKKLELSCDLHPYTISRHRLFGSDYGLFAIFDIPAGSYNNLTTFFEILQQRDFCKKFFIYTSSKNRILHVNPLLDNIIDSEEFDIVGYFSQSVEDKQVENLGREFTSNSLEFHPIELLILRDITTNMRIPITELLKKYQNYLKLPSDKDAFYSLPRGFRPYLKEFFAEDRSENAIYLDFKKKYHSIVDNHIESYWLGVNRKYFEMFVRLLYIIHDVPKEEKLRLFTLLRTIRPPFYIYVEELGRDMLISISLPPYYLTKFAYYLRDNFEKFSVYLIDSFESNAMKYRFYVHNYDIINHKMRDDKEWMITEPIKSIKDDISKNMFRRVSSISG